MNFLNESLLAQRIGLTGGIIGQNATLFGIDKIYNKYFENKVSIPDINRIILTSLMLGIVADFIAIRIAFEKYRYLLEKYKKGEINYSLRPNIILIYANLIGTLGDLLGLLAVIKIANREGIIITRPVR